VNLRLVTFAAVVSALLGGLFGLTLSYLGQPNQGGLRYESPFYRSLYRHMPWIGGGLGAVFGAGFAVVSQSARRRHAPKDRR
jgi:hypothetical protein